MLGEFEQIAQIMAPLAEKAEGAFALKNDAAVFHHDAGEEIVVTTDTLIAGVHFFETDEPELLAQKILGVNLSDLAAMGAKPAHYTLNASYPADITSDWIKRFAHGLHETQKRFNISLLGGDTTRTPGPLCFSLTAYGTVTKGKALQRLGARVGDLVCVSGTIGDAALGLLAMQNKIKDESGWLAFRYQVPNARTALGQALVSVARSCLDISDGLITDMRHMQVGMEIEQKAIPLSDAAQHAIAEDSSFFGQVLNGGDDYELLFSIAPDKAEQLTDIAEQTATKISIIGRITESPEIRILQEDGQLYTDYPHGYRHF
ncbi:thiamine-phosphate kinase [Terasakiella sp. SH-1]|uniref:thiamine-phosphate kinase n=1 Tax=Terasakiella sp. SH-1 TaxID=2560057 RepID=UPI001072F5BD|nr:thiamine-phosphate kinase [Terasakiella sp. SH-1]